MPEGAGVGDDHRFDRNERLFGREGQLRLAAATITIVGLGGLGSHVAQQAAYLGVRRFGLVDGDIVTPSSLNRLIGSLPGDVANATPKVDIAYRLITSIEPKAVVRREHGWLEAPASANLIQGSDLIVGCLDDDLARLRLTALAVEANRPYIDLASDVGPGADWYGGRVVFSIPGVRCLYCLGELDAEELALARLTDMQRGVRDDSYGVPRDVLGEPGAAVVSLNGTVASLGVTELMAYLTGLRAPMAVLRYRADQQRITHSASDPTIPCPYCRRD